MPKMQEETTEMGARTASEAVREMLWRKAKEAVKERMGTPAAKAILEGLDKGEEHSSTEEVFRLSDGVLVIKATYSTRTYRPHSTVEAGGEGGEESSQAEKPDEPRRFLPRTQEES